MKDNLIKFRVSKIENLIIKKKASNAGMSVSELMRGLVLGYKLSTKLTPDEIECYKLLSKFADNFRRISNLFKLGDVDGFKKGVPKYQCRNSSTLNEAEMIGMAKSCSGGGALGNYVMDEKKGYELDRNNLCGSTPKEIIEEMKIIQDLNQRATNKTFSMVISPDIKDGKNLSDDELRGITRDYLNKLGIDTEKQQYVAFVHTEKEHKHVHIIANRVQSNGKLISDHHIGKRSQWIAHGIAKEKGLVSAKEKMFENLKNIDKVKDNLKTEIFSKHQAVMKERPQTFQNYINQMKQQGLEGKSNNQQTGGKFKGFRVRDLKTDKEYKMSEIHRSMSASSLIKSGLKNDLNHKLDTTLKRVNHKQTKQTSINKAVGINKELKSIKNDLAFEIKKEAKSIKNNAEFQLKSTGKSFLKTSIKPPKMSREEYKMELKFREGVKDTKLATLLNEKIEYETKANLRINENQEQEQKSEPKNEI